MDELASAGLHVGVSMCADFGRHDSLCFSLMGVGGAILRLREIREVSPAVERLLPLGSQI